MSNGSDGRPIRLHWDEDRCTTCMSCMVVCAERHVGMSAASQSRIWVLPDLLGADYTAEYCRQCKNAPCAVACPEEAIQLDDSVGAWLVDLDLCTGCGQCVEECPFDAIKLDPISGMAMKCDLCLGATWCVEVCQTNALSVRGRSQEAGNAE